MSRGEASFIRMPRFGSRLYDRLMGSKATTGYYRNLAERLRERLTEGRLLDVGTGPGRLLREVHNLAPQVELYGLDISAAMVELAREKLAGLSPDLRPGNINHTDYAGDFFDAVASSGSFYLWDRPGEGLAEIQRILRPGAAAWLYETHQDYDPASLRQALRNNLAADPWLHRLLAPRFLRQQLKMSYRRDELKAIFTASPFRETYRIEAIPLGGLPIWLEIELRKPA
jgi:ubiquinone/menaquinone biosynthesis C-methylase UbiE